MESAALELDLDALLDRGDPQLGQTGNDRHRELLVRELGERVAAPQRVGFGQHRDSFGMIACAQSGAAAAHEVLETVHVDVIVGNLEGVAAAPRREQRRIGKGPSQLRHQRLQAVAHACRWILAPQRVDELLGGDDSTRLQRQQGQQGAQLRPCDDDVRSVVVAHFELTEEPHPHALTVPPIAAHRSRAPEARAQPPGHPRDDEAPRGAVHHPDRSDPA